MRHVLDDGTVSAPIGVHDREPADERDFPTFTVLQPPAAGTDLTRTMIFHAGIGKGKAKYRQDTGDRPERQRRSGTMTRWPTASAAMPRTSCRAAR